MVFLPLLRVDYCGVLNVGSFMQLYDASGTPLSSQPPSPLTATFCRSVYYQGPTRHDVVVEDGKAVTQVKNDLVRAQWPHLVRLLVYRSKFQMQPDEREYFVYAPMDYKSSVKLVMRLWRRWEKPRKAGWEFVEDLNDDYPKVDDAAVSEPIDDNFFDEMWNAAKQRKHLSAGHPGDPFAFTCLDPSIKVYRTEDFQKDLVATV
jgi:hypothetical protein